MDGCASDRHRPAASRLILVIDDDATVRDLMRGSSSARIRGATAAGGHEGLRLARELRPAAITLDINMPDLDGWTVLAAHQGRPDACGHPGHPRDHRGRRRTAASRSAPPTTWSSRSTANARQRAAQDCCSSVARRMLLVDDDEIVRDGMRRALEQEGWQVTRGGQRPRRAGAARRTAAGRRSCSI